MKTSWIIGIATTLLAAPAMAQNAALPATAAQTAQAGQQAPSTPPSSAATRLSAARQNHVDRADVEGRLKAVAQLIEKSSAARQIEARGSERERQLRARAEDTHREAQAAFDAGDLPRASALLTQASTLMFEAVRLAQPAAVTAEKEKTDYQTRRDSVIALLGAYARIAKEKSGVKGVAEIRQNIETGLSDAESLAGSGRYTEARAVLDRSYLVAKAVVASLRGGDTLVRSLQFTSKEEEYRYELDRNDTHRMLIRLLLQDKGAAADDARQKPVLAQAERLRGDAEKTAAQGDFAAAIGLLEKSTAELVKAIRNAGIYIPG